jgi:hypothetical protein
MSEAHNVTIEAERLEAFTADRCARIAASIDVEPANAAGILEANGLGAAEWAALDDHWEAQAEEQIAFGSTALLDRQDDVYLERIEAERGPVSAEEYARICLAEERGTISATLADLELPEPSAIRIQRVWLRRASSNAELAAALDRSIASLRAG